MTDVQEFGLLYEDEDVCEWEDLSGASSDKVLAVCLNKLGRVDLVRMSRCSGKSCEQLILDLRGSAIFQDPAVFEHEEQWSIDKGWLDKAQYCSGNIRKKLTLARRMNKKFPGCFECNVLALKQILPTALDMTEIRASLGAPWIPAELYAEFIQELLNLSCMPSVVFNKELCTWQVRLPDEAKRSVANTMIYGTVDLSAGKIIEQTMNAKTVKVYDSYPTKGWKYERVFNKDATLAAQEKQKAILRAFEKWMNADRYRRTLLEDYYNDAFVGYHASVYDGSFLQFPDLNPAVSFYPHQRNAIARMLLSKENLLLAHDVGTGKTYEMCAGVHELYRMGLSKKNLVVVPNNVLKATVDAHRYLYPDDKLLAVFPKDFTPSDRNGILKKVRDGDYVAVYMAYSSFDMIVMSKAYWVDKMTREINALHKAISTARHKDEKRLLERQKSVFAKSRQRISWKKPIRRGFRLNSSVSRRWWWTRRTITRISRYTPERITLSVCTRRAVRSARRCWRKRGSSRR